MSDIAPAARLALRGLAAAGVLAAGTALGAAAEGAMVRRRMRRDTSDEPYGSLRSGPVQVRADDGTLLHVEVDEADPEHAGDGLTVVFSHGYALNLDSWHFQRKELRGLARLVFWDQRSHGRSGRAPTDTVHIDQLGRDLAAVVEAVAPDAPLVLVGHSMGGMTVMALADQHPEWFGTRVRGAALLATTSGDLRDVSLGLPAWAARLLHRVGPDAAAALARQRDLVERGRETGSDLGLLLTRLYSFGSAVPASMNRFVAEMIASTPIDVLADFLPALQVHDKRQALAALQHVETLVMVGDTDRLTPSNHSDEIVRRVPGAEFVLLPDTGHMLELERYEEVDRHLRDLLARVRRHLARGEDASGGTTSSPAAAAAQDAAVEVAMGPSVPGATAVPDPTGEPDGSEGALR